MVIHGIKCKMPALPKYCEWFEKFVSLYPVLKIPFKGLKSNYEILQYQQKSEWRKFRGRRN